MDSIWLLLVLIGGLLVIAGLLSERRHPPGSLPQLPDRNSLTEVTPAAEQEVLPASPPAGAAILPGIRPDNQQTTEEQPPRPAGLTAQTGPPDVIDTAVSPASLPHPRLNFRFSFDQTLFLLALIVYLLTRLLWLNEYPIYFFTDEAINTTLASDFVRDGFRDFEGQLFPTFFKNYDKYNLSTSVYLQVIPALLFDRSVDITRGVALLVTLLAAISVGLILHQVFASRAWWSGVLVLSVTPAWFLHSRTAFETALMVAFYAPFLYFYLRYCGGSGRALYAAVFFASLAFYTYSPARVIIPLTALLFLIFDLRYHLANRRTVMLAGVLVLICALPYLRFELTHPQAAADQLYFQGSYWLREGSLTSKLVTFSTEYLKGLNPIYWYAPGQQDIARHRFGPYGHLPLPLAPFLAAGLVYSLLRLRKPEHRTLLLAVLAVPAGSALIEVGITRLLALVIPFSIYTGLGIAWMLDWLASHKIRYRRAAAVVFAILVGANAWLLAVARSRAPTWSLDYGLTGMQWGSSQVFAEIQDFLRRDPDLQVTLSSTWANGTDTLARFFINQDPLPIQFASVDYFINQKVANIDRILAVLPFYEYQRAIDSGKFQQIQIEKRLDYPDGEPGFYFVRFDYSPEIDAILDAESEFRRQPLEDIVIIDGEEVAVRFSRLDIGPIQNAFDGDLRSMCRTLEANPAVLEFEFKEPRTFSGIAIVIGSTEARISFTATLGDNSETIEFSRQGTVENPEVSYAFPSRLEGDRVRLEIQDLHQSEPGNVHYWEIRFDE